MCNPSFVERTATKEKENFHKPLKPFHKRRMLDGNRIINWKVNYLKFIMREFLYFLRTLFNTTITIYTIRYYFKFKVIIFEIFSFVNPIYIFNVNYTKLKNRYSK